MDRLMGFSFSYHFLIMWMQELYLMQCHPIVTLMAFMQRTQGCFHKDGPASFLVLPPVFKK
jgi:hypothetical protein